jgi:hypothetical protein
LKTESNPFHFEFRRLMTLSERITRAGECLLCAEELIFKRKRSGVFRPVNELEVGNVG